MPRLYALRGPWDMLGRQRHSHFPVSVRSPGSCISPSSGRKRPAGRHGLSPHVAAAAYFQRTVAIGVLYVNEAEKMRANFNGSRHSETFQF